MKQSLSVSGIISKCSSISRDHELRNRLLTTLMACFGYAAIALTMTYPLGLHLSTHFPADSHWDVSTQIWNAWWVHHVLSSKSLDFFNTIYMLYPLGINLVFHNFLMHSVMASILWPIFGQVASFNTAFLLTFVLSGYGTYLLIDYLLDNKTASFVGGLIFAFCPYRFAHAFSGHMDLMHTEWIPFFILYFLKTIDSCKKRDAVISGLFLFLVTLSDYNYTIFLAIFSLIALVYTIFKKNKNLSYAKTIGRMSILLIVFLILFSPIIITMVSSTNMHEFESAAGWKGGDEFIADLLGYINPRETQPLYGKFFTQTNSQFIGNRGETTVFAGWLVLALSLYAIFRRRLRKQTHIWLISGLVFFLLSLGPMLHISGKIWPKIDWFEIDGLVFGVPLPYTAFHFVPFLDEVRCPARFSLMVMLSLAVLSSYAIVDIVRYIKPLKNQFLRQSLTLVTFLGISTVILVEFYPGKLPIWSAEVPSVYKEIAKDTQDFTVLEIPMGWRDGFRISGDEDTKLLYFQTTHQKRLINAMTSRIPLWKTDYYYNIPIIGIIPYLEQPAPESNPVMQNIWGYVAQDKDISKEVARFFNIKYIIIHQPYIGKEVESYVTGVFDTELFSNADDYSAYRVTVSRNTDPFSIHMGGRLAKMYAVRGWDIIPSNADSEGYARAAEPEAIIMTPPQDEKDQKIKLTMKSGPLVHKQKVSISINGQALKTIMLSKSWKEHEIIVPKKYLTTYNTEIRFFTHPWNNANVPALKKVTISSQ